MLGIAEVITESFVIRHAGTAIKGQSDRHSVIASGMLSPQMPPDTLHIAGTFTSLAQSETD